MAALNHPNILQVYDWGEEDGEPYLVLEFLAGGSLRAGVRHRGPAHPRAGRAVGLEAAAGLDYAHRRGLVHRDIKPANLLFDADAAAPDRRLRPGPGPGRGGVDRAGRRHPGHRPLRRPRAGRGVGARRQGRRLRPGPGPLRGGDRRGPLHRRHHRGHPDGPGGRPAARARGARARSTTCWCGRPPPSPSERFDAAQLAVRLGALAETLP